MTVTAKAIEHLRIVRDNGPMLPGEFGQRAWPNMIERGAGDRGGGSNVAICGAGRLGRLQKARWVVYVFGHGQRGYQITPAGRKVLWKGLTA